jgi:hypothetical protein
MTTVGRFLYLVFNLHTVVEQQSRGMSKLKTSLKKLLIGIVSSGDFEILNFKDKLKVYLDYVSGYFPSITDESEQLVSAAISSVIAEVEPSSFPRAEKMPLPKGNRLWLNMFYAHYMIEKDFSSQEQLLDWAKAAYPELEIPAEQSEFAYDAIKLYNSRKRKRTFGDGDELEPKRKKAKVKDK